VFGVYPQVKRAKEPTAGAPGLGLSAFKAVAPGVTATVQGAADDVSQQLGAGNYGAAAGQALRGALALPAAAIDDAVGRPLRAVSSAVAPAAAGVGNALFTAATGDNEPVFGLPPASAPMVGPA